MNKRSNRRRGNAGKCPPGPKAMSEADMAWALAKKAAAGVNQLRKLVNVERKFVTLENQSPTTTTSGSCNLLNGVPQGDGAETRDGASIRFVKLQFRTTFQLHNSATRTFVRAMLIWYRENNAGAKAVSDILQQPTDTKSFENENNIGKFRVLKDRHFALTDTDVSALTIDWIVKSDWHSTYSPASTGGAATDMQTGSLYFVVLSSEATNAPYCYYSSKCVFIDN